MNNLLAEGESVVREAEASLRQLMQSAVQEGQYDRVAVLARWAEQLSQITENGAAITAQPEMEAGGRGAAANRTSRLPKVRKRAKRQKSKYPIFKRFDNNLVKVAWSKTSKSEYQHQAPKSVIFELFQKMAETASGDALITMDNVLPLVSDDQPEVPAYQSYACLAWLRGIGVVEQHGRQGYSVRAANDAKRSIESAWRELPPHRL